MSTTEALRTQLDVLQTQYNLLKVQNRRLRDENPQQDEVLQLEHELDETRQENVQLSQTIVALKAKLGEQEEQTGTWTDELERSVETLTCEATALRVQLDAMTVELADEKCEVTQATSRAETAEEYAKHLEEELDRLRRGSELERLQAVAEETRKWEAREAQLIRRVDELERDESKLEKEHEGVKNTAAATEDERAEVLIGDKTGSLTSIPVKSDKRLDSPVKLDLSPPTVVPTSSVATGDHLSMALLAQQFPPLPKFTGDNLDDDAENLEEWLEQTELVAQGCGWNEQAKLFSVVARLRGSASGFYRSCTPQQRSSYKLLTAALRERFTPVRIQSVQSSKFHGRKQLVTETVDQYAQDLKKLFLRAYPPRQCEAPGAEIMAQSVIAYQFVDGLLPEIKVKLAGCKGTSLARLDSRKPA